ncbi:MAG: serine/threonine protein kinase, partial [Planctomycetes bacterium]|nr:serine/threonine protein kinase [Planctomycetota bacterium]
MGNPQVPLSSTGSYHEPVSGEEKLIAQYNAIVGSDRLIWLTLHRKVRLLGTGGQGLVFLSRRLGADQFTLPIALKVFSPRPYRDENDYAQSMTRIAQVAARVALIQHDNVLDIHNFQEEEGIRIMEMEWVDGHDLARLLTPEMLEIARWRLAPEAWTYLNNVIVTEGPRQPRLKPGIAIEVVRECLAGLAALHRAGIVHGDLKPSNIMLKRTGNAKVIDIGSAIDLRAGPAKRIWSPVYAAPEILQGAENSPRSDLASLGYVLIEMLAGQPLFADLTTYQELLQAKQQLEQRLPELLPPEVRSHDLLLNLCRRLTAFEPEQRFASAEAAELEQHGAAEFHHQLVKGDLAS